LDIRVKLILSADIIRQIDVTRVIYGINVEVLIHIKISGVARLFGTG
jgi:hypothetical protein